MKAISHTKHNTTACSTSVLSVETTQLLSNVVPSQHLSTSIVDCHLFWITFHCYYNAWCILVNTSVSLLFPLCTTFSMLLIKVITPNYPLRIYKPLCSERLPGQFTSRDTNHWTLNSNTDTSTLRTWSETDSRKARLILKCSSRNSIWTSPCFVDHLDIWQAKCANNISGNWEHLVSHIHVQCNTLSNNRLLTD